MDERTRGFIESRFDEYVKAEILPDIRWIPNEVPISSMGDLALGYMVGIFYATAVTIGTLGSEKGLSKGWKKKITAMLKRRLPELVDRINKELHR